MLRLRRAEPLDEERLLAWRNEPGTLAASFSPGEVTPEEHHDWLARKLADPGCVLSIVEESGRPVGQVRLDRIDGELAEISIGLAPDARGRGLGREALRLAALDARRLFGVRGILARVKPENEASLAAFRAAGYRVVSEDAAEVRLLLALDGDPPAG